MQSNSFLKIIATFVSRLNKNNSIQIHTDPYPRLHFVYIQGKAAFSHKFLKHRPQGQPGSFPFHRTNTTDKPIALTILKKVATLGMVIPFSILDI